MMGHYGGSAAKSTSLFSNVYRPPSAQIYYQEEVVDYGAHSHQENLLRQQNGAKQAPPARLYPHTPFQNDPHDTMFAHGQSTSLLAGPATSANTTHHTAQRREGRMVPTTDASIFDARRRDKERVREKQYKSREGAGEHLISSSLEHETRHSIMEAERLPAADRARSFGEGQSTEAATETNQMQAVKAFGSRPMAWPYGGERPFVNPRSHSPSTRVVTVDGE